tara:strand:- start:1975 stop:2313 length:339 start_codon:yes stop_codon:yes gene_type:complete
MSTQATTASAFSNTGGRSYLVTATDDAFSRLVSETGSAQLGFAQTGLVVSSIQVTYAAGLCAWRVRNSVSQITKRTGFGFLVGPAGPPPYSGAISPFTVEQDDVLEVFTQVA